MKDNPEEVAQLQPDYLGFIFWEPSSRYFDGAVLQIASAIEKIGVFVDADLSSVLEHIKKYNLQGVQLHGKETPEYCKKLNKLKQKLDFKIIKVFSVKEKFDLSVLKEYEEVCDYFLFDTKGKLPGGNGFTFDWSLLKDYPSSKPYFLSGGIGLENVEEIKEFMRSPESNYCYALDVNSKFEEKPGLKNIEKLKEFKSLLSI
ncbi:phosphoribosylanthranilate isomerase [Maribacter litopenaei]|uniref:N-(5'-phosphoribosyl)anthranilate isomerase n=2 Tax=Maribacter litopenaei TaxID=2976127 RepID=A0ABY5Y4Y4_9FLAO|nr:phosphoribosylanthranilate isomerase [Maribacter litopenaei]UWX54087.1 phosphoribosylanthranilate isomerase [Maribacter litopenaei]